MSYIIRIYGGNKERRILQSGRQSALGEENVQISGKPVELGENDFLYPVTLLYSGTQEPYPILTRSLKKVKENLETGFHYKGAFGKMDILQGFGDENAASMVLISEPKLEAFKEKYDLVVKPQEEKSQQEAPAQ